MNCNSIEVRSNVSEIPSEIISSIESDSGIKMLAVLSSLLRTSRRQTRAWDLALPLR